MTRQILPYGKKRGHRSTGQGMLGNAGLALFFGLFLLIGCVLLGALIWLLVIPEWRANHRFIETRCVVLEKRLAEHESDGSTSYRPELLIQYDVAGQAYEIWTYDITRAYSSGRADKEAILQQFEADKDYACWYDPQHPETAVLVRGYTWFAWLLLLLPISFIAVGGGGLAYRLLGYGTSIERRAAMAKRVAEIDLFETADPTEREFPTLPRGSNLTNSPGTRLAYRLPIAVSPAWALLCILAGCLFWNGMVAVFVTIAVNSHLRGEPEWFLTFLSIPFLLAGIGLAIWTLRQLLIVTGVGPTLVEISQHPLHPGGECRIFLSQSGRLSMNSLTLRLVCEESATFQQGTNTRTETTRVFDSNIFSREAFEIQQELPFETTTEMRVPPGAMHSFKANHNEIKWKLIVLGDVARWPNFERQFPVVVFPESHASGGK